MTTNDNSFSVYLPEDYELLTKEQLKKEDIDTAKTISQKECNDKSINVSLIAYKELSNIGFKKDIPTYFLSKLIENLYHERKEFDSSSYFDLTMDDNEHYKELATYYNIGDEKFYRAMIATAIGNSNCETKNVNDIVYKIVTSIPNLTNTYVKK
ncbi:MAG: hypothetical protein J5970_00480 [Bacilli bacterium]|nr:hypothetical protein [Bacilli bacterium]